MKNSSIILAVLLIIYLVSYFVVRNTNSVREDEIITSYNEKGPNVLLYYLHYPIILIDRTVSGRRIEMNKWRQSVPAYVKNRLFLSEVDVYNVDFMVKGVSEVNKTILVPVADRPLIINSLLLDQEWLNNHENKNSVTVAAVIGIVSINKIEFKWIDSRGSYIGRKYFEILHVAK